MKKKIIIPIIIFLILVIGIISIVIISNRTVSTITLDINPSIEINLTKKDKVKNIIALNEDAKDIADKKIKGKTLDEALNIITNNLIDKGYAEDKQILILLHSEGNIDNQKIDNKLRNIFGEKEIFTDIVIIENITADDEKLAKKYNITPAKAAYINSITKENNDIPIESLIDKPVNELKETKETGKYCNEGYNLEGDFCLKEINRISAQNGKVCPEGYYEYENKCYEEIQFEETDKLMCTDEFTLKETKCSRTITIDAEPVEYSCISGEKKTRLEMGLTDANAGDANDIVCVDFSSATHPVSPCEANDGTEYTISGGICYWHRAPVIEIGCPGKIQVNGECWDDASNIYICVGYRDGKQYSSKDEYCENSIKYIDPIVTEYKCPEGHILNGTKCIKEEIEDAWHEKVCPSGYTLVNYDRCINKNKTTNFIDGYVCNKENTRLEGNTCIILDMVEAKRKE